MIHVFYIFAEDALPKPSTKLAPTTSCVPRLALTKSGFVFNFFERQSCYVALRCFVSFHVVLCFVVSSCFVILCEIWLCNIVVLSSCVLLVVTCVSCGSFFRQCCFCL